METTEYGTVLTRGPYRTTAEMRVANERAGRYFFSAGAMRFFRSRVQTGVYGGRLFITSEQFEDSRGNRARRRYTVRACLDNGTVETVGEFQAYATRSAAVHAADRIARNMED